MAVTGLGDWPIRSPLIRRNRLYKEVSYNNRNSDSPIHTIISDYFFNAAASSSVLRPYYFLMMPIGSGSNV